MAAPSPHSWHGCGLVEEHRLVALVADEYHLPIVDPRCVEVPGDAIDAVPPTLARRHELVPIALDGSTLTIAMVDPASPIAVSEIKFLTGRDVRIAVASPSAVHATIERLYGARPHSPTRSHSSGLRSSATIPTAIRSGSRSLRASRRLSYGW